MRLVRERTQEEPRHGVVPDSPSSGAAQGSQEHYRHLLEAASDLVIVLESGGLILEISQAGSDLLGYSPEELIGHSYLEFVHPDDVMKTIDAENATPDSKGVSSFVNRCVAQDGTIVWLEWRTVYTGEVAYGVARAITELEAADSRMRVLKRSLHALSQGNQAIIRASDEQGLLSEMCRIIVEVGGYGLAWVGMVEDERTLALRPVALAGEGASYLEGCTFLWGQVGTRLPGPRALFTGETQVVQDITLTEVDLPRVAHLRELGLRSEILLPLRHRERVFGLLAVYSKESGAFCPEEVTLLEELAIDLSYGLTSLRSEQERRKAVHDRLRAEENLRRSVLQLEKALEGTVQALASALESRDSYTAGHMRRVADLAQAIAKRMGMPADRVRGVFWAGTLHDIGKIQVPAEILSKPGRLSPIETAIIRTHPEAGYQILGNVDFPWPIAQMVLQHHERLDGKGYPNGLTADEIRLEARILSVADVLEAGTSRRPYRPQGDEAKIWRELSVDDAAGFDQAVVAACREVWPEVRARWAQQAAARREAK